MSEDKQLPLSCPFVGEEGTQVIRRRDVKQLGETFKESLSPLGQILQHMQELNLNWGLSNTRMKRLVLWQVVLLGLSLGSLLMLALAYQQMRLALSKLTDNAAQLHEVQVSMQANVEELQKVRTSTFNTEVAVEAVKKEQEERPKLELVPETDPVKAMRAPVRLRVLPPPSAAVPLLAPLSSSGAGGMADPSPPPAPPAAIADIPLPAEGF